MAQAIPRVANRTPIHFVCMRTAYTAVMWWLLTIALAMASPSFDDLSWLAGQWLRVEDDSRAEEHWMAPSGDSMVGMFRLQNETGETVFVELLTIVRSGEHLALRIRHMTPELGIWESEKDGPVVYTLASITPDKAVFANPADDVRELIFEKLGPKQMRIRLVFAEPGKVVDYPFVRQ